MNDIRFIYLKNIILFLMFGVIIAVATTTINYKLKYNEGIEAISNRTIGDHQKIQNYAKELIKNGENSLTAIKNSNIFTKYLKNPAKKDDILSLFLSTMYNNENFFQLRYLDNNGYEKLRIDKKEGEVYIVQDNYLQNKSKRDYFKETIANKNDSFWYSKFNLNMEHGKVEIPFKPTIRISTNIFFEGEHSGMLIVNIDMNKLKNFIKSFKDFEVSLVDKDGAYLIDSDREKAWSKYLGKEYNFKKEHPKILLNDTSKQISKNDFFYSQSMENIFKNKEHINLILRAHDKFLKDIQANSLKYIYSIGLWIFVISIILSFLISAPTSKMYLRYNTIYEKNLHHINVIDKYVNTVIIDADKKIVNISNALCKNSGYKKEEILGKPLFFFISKKTDIQSYKKVLDQANKKGVASGDFLHVKKNGDDLWLHSTILSTYDKNGKIESYNIIAEDNTDKKIIEKIAQTDKLTGLYNRVMLDKELSKELNRFERHLEPFSIIMADIDHFKAVNDTYGHNIGDSVLVEFSNILKTNCRKTDIVGRWGGEEFLILCINTNLQGATELAKNLKNTIESFNFKIVKHKTASFGVTEVVVGDTRESLTQRVDENLYKAKESGRNKVFSNSI